LPIDLDKHISGAKMAATCKEVTNLIYMSVTYCFTWKKYSPIIEWE